MSSKYIHTRLYLSAATPLSVELPTARAGGLGMPHTPTHARLSEFSKF